MSAMIGPAIWACVDVGACASTLTNLFRMCTGMLTQKLFFVCVWGKTIRVPTPPPLPPR